jgi:hypothetical protein
MLVGVDIRHFHRSALKYTKYGNKKQQKLAPATEISVREKGKKTFLFSTNKRRLLKGWSRLRG